jgi:hypothetical protein
MLTIDDTNKGRIRLLFKEKHIGDAILDVDGFYYFYPLLQGGLWSEYSLTLILDKLKELNKPILDKLKEMNEPNFQNYLLEFPEMTDEELKNIEEKRKHFNKWK